MATKAPRHEEKFLVPLGLVARKKIRVTKALRQEEHPLVPRDFVAKLKFSAHNH